MISILFETFGEMAIMLAVGYYLAKKGILSKEVISKLSDILINVLLTSSIVASFVRPFDSRTGRTILVMMVVASVIYTFSTILGQLVFKLLKYPEDKAKAATLCTVYQNSGFIGFPICQNLFSAEGYLYAVSYGNMYNPFMFIWGVRILSGTKGKPTLKSIFTPPVLACIIGGIFYFFQIPMPSFAYKALSAMGSSMTPMAMLILGAGMVGVSLKDIFGDWMVYPAVAMRLLVVPILAYLALLPVSFLSVEAKQVAVTMAAIPVGSMNVILARKYGKDHEFANNVLLLSMLFCVVTLPLLTLLPY